MAFTRFESAHVGLQPSHKNELPQKQGGPGPIGRSEAEQTDETLDITMADDQKQYLWAFSPVAPKQAWRTLGRALYGATGTTLWLVDRSTLVSPTEYGDGRFTFDHADVWYLPVEKILIAYGEELLERAGLEGLTDEEIDE